MADKTLEVKISALVEGLDKLNAMVESLKEIILLSTKTNSEAGQGLDKFSASAASAATASNKLTSATKETATAITSAVSKEKELGAQSAALKNNIDALAQTQEKVTWGTDRMVESASKMSDSAKNSSKNLQDQTKSMQDAAQATNELASYLKVAAVAFVAFLGVKGIKDMADYAARTETLGKTLEVVGRNAGYTKQELETYEAGLKKLGITSQSARESMTAMVQAGIPLGAQAGQSASNVERLARASQDLAVVTGQNSSETFQRLITNIQQMDTMGLRFMGITTDIQAAQATYAQSIGKATGALTQQEKTLGVMNAVLAEADKLAGAYAESMETVGKKLGSLKRYQDELANSIGKMFLPAYGVIVDKATEVLKALQEIADEFDKDGTAAISFADAVGGALNEIAKLIVSTAKFFAENKDVLVSIGQNLAGIVQDFFALANAIGGAGEELGVLDGIFWSVGLAVAGLRDGFKLAYAVAAQMVGGITKFLGDLLYVIGLAAEAMGMKGFGKSLQEVGASMRVVAIQSQNAAKQIYEDFGNANTATQQYLTTLGEVSDAQKSFGKGTDFETIRTQITRLKAELRDGKITSQDLKGAMDALGASISGAGESGKITEAQMKQLNSELKSAATSDLKQLQEAWKNLGITSAELSTGVSENFSTMAGAMATVISKAQTTAQTIQQLFSEKINTAKSVQELSVLSQGLVELQNRAKKLTEQGITLSIKGDFEKSNAALKEAADLQAVLEKATAQTTNKYNELIEAGLKTATTQEQISQVVQAATTMFNNGSISAQTYIDSIGKINEKIVELEKEAQFPQTIAGLKQLGVSFKDLETNTSEAGRAVVEGLRKITSEAKLTSDQMYSAFSKGISGAKVIGDLKGINDQLQLAAKNGSLTGQALSSAASAASQKFDELFKSQLNAAKTKEDLALLTHQVEDMGKSGEISGTKVALSLQQIADKASGGTAEVARLQAQLAGLAEQAAKVEQARLADDKSRTSVIQAQLTVANAKAEADKKGTEASKQALAIAQADLVVAEQQNVLTGLKIRLEEALLSLKQAQANYADAQARAEREGTDAAALALKIAKEKRDLAQKEADDAKEKASFQDKNVAGAQRAAEGEKQKALKLKESTAELQLQGVQYDKNNNALDTSGKKVSMLIPTTEYFMKQLTGAGLSIEDATNKSRDFMDQWSHQSQMGGMQGVANFFAKQNEAIQNVKDAIQMDQREKAAASERLAQWNQFTSELNATGTSATKVTEAFMNFPSASSATASAMNQIRDSAAGAARSAQDAVASFLRSTEQIHEQSLKAQGNETEAIAASYEAKKKSLALDYQMLEVKIKTAIAEAKAAKIGTGDLEKSLSDAKAGRDQAMIDLENQKQAEIKAQREKEAAEKAATEEKKKQAELDAQAKKDRDAAAEASKKEAEDAKKAAQEKATIEAATDEATAKAAQVQVETEKAITQEVLTRAELRKRQAEEAQKNVQEAVTRSRMLLEGGLTSTTSEIDKASTSSSSAIGVTEMGKIEIHINGKPTTVYTEKGTTEDVMKQLSELKSVSSKR